MPKGLTSKAKLHIILTLAVMVFIFVQSALPGEVSGAESNVIVQFISGLTGIPADSLGFFVRKAAHFTEFMILGILAKTNQEEYTDRNTILVPLLFSALYAISDEIHQSFVPGRCCAVKDMLIDTSGAFTGIIIYHLIMKGWKRRHSH